MPINFDATRQAQGEKIAGCKRALGILVQGGPIDVFPCCCGAGVFHGHTSRLFQLANQIHMNPPLGLLANELARQPDKPAQISIGAPLEHADLDPLAADPKRMMDFLRKATYELGVNRSNLLRRDMILRTGTAGYGYGSRHF